MLDQVRLKIQKYQFIRQMHLTLKNDYETSRCLIGDKWSNNESDSVIVLIIAVVPLVIDDHVIQDNASTHDQSESALRVRPIRDNSMLKLFFNRSKEHFTSFLIDTCFIEKNWMLLLYKR
jgi:hypothetical protein